MLLLLVLLLIPAAAYETDQLTDRDEPLADAAEALDAWMTRTLVLAVSETNAQTQCRGSERHLRQVLAHSIHRRTADDTHLSNRGLVRGMGYDRVMAFLEESPVVERRAFPERGDLFGLAKLDEAAILATAGVCGTVKLAGVLMGTDKPSHFTDVGYDYYRRSRDGLRPSRAVRYGTRTERSYYGSMTSSSFSYADLRANWDGYRFYAGLLKPGSPVQRREEGCLEVVAPFRWADWVDWEYDEVLNPSVYTAGAQAAVDRRLTLDRDHYCGQYQALGGADFDAKLAENLAKSPHYYGDKAPPREDPFGLAERCAGWQPPAGPQPTTPRRRWERLSGGG